MSNLTRRNPMTPVKTAFTVNTVLGGGGAAVGAGTAATGSRGAGAMTGVQTGLGLGGLGGMIVGFLSPKRREAAFATAGVALASLVVVGLVQKYAMPALTPATPATTPATT